MSNAGRDVEDKPVATGVAAMDDDHERCHAALEALQQQPTLKGLTEFVRARASRRPCVRVFEVVFRVLSSLMCFWVVLTLATLAAQQQQQQPTVHARKCTTNYQKPP